VKTNKLIVMNNDHLSHYRPWWHIQCSIDTAAASQCSEAIVELGVV